MEIVTVNLLNELYTLVFINYTLKRHLYINEILSYVLY